MFTQNRIVKTHPNILLIATNGEKTILANYEKHRLLGLKHIEICFLILKNLKDKQRQLLTKKG